MVVFRSLFLTAILLLACWFTFPSPAAAGGNNKHGGGNSGIDILLTTGVIAKLLQNGRGGGGGGARSVPIGGRHYESPHGAPSMRVMMPHHHGPPPMHFPPPMHIQSQPMMVFPQPMHMNPQQQPGQGGSHQTDSEPRIPGYSAQTTNQNTAYGHFSDFQPKDKIEIIRM